MNIVIENLKNHLFIIDELLPILHQQINTKLNSPHLEKMHISIKMSFLYKLLENREIQDTQDEPETIYYLAKKSSFLVNSEMKINNISTYICDFSYLSKSGVNSKIKFSPYLCFVSNTNFRGASHPHMLGLIFLNQDKFKNIDEKELSIIHELAHQELFLLNMIDRLVNSETSHILIHSPYQGKQRPAIGRLHSAHALFRMIQLCNSKQLFEEANKFKIILDETINTFSDNDLTVLGTQLKAIYKEII